MIYRAKWLDIEQYGYVNIFIKTKPFSFLFSIPIIFQYWPYLTTGSFQSFVSVSLWPNFQGIRYTPHWDT